MVIFILLGVISSIFQLTLLREFTFSIAKNELSFVIAVGMWLLFASMGSLAGRRKAFLRQLFLPLMLTLIFGVSICLIHLVKSMFGLTYYEVSSLYFVLVSSLALIGAPSFLMGYCFGAFSTGYLESHPYLQKNFARFFAYEALGFFIGGVFYTFFLSGYSNPLVFAAMPLLFLFALPGPAVKRTLSGLAVILISFIFFVSFDPLLKKELKGADILMNKASRYGPVILARQFGVESLYVNGSLIATSEDKAWNEEFIHVSLSARKSIKDVLFIGPYFSGQVGEILKHGIERLDCVDINPVLSSLAADRIPAAEKALAGLIVDDPRLYIRDTDRRYDCVIMNMGAPSNLTFNRYFSLEFFRLVEKRLTAGGVFCFYIPSKRDILSPNILDFDSCMINTLDKVFTDKLLVPSDTMIVIASDSALNSGELIENFSASGVKTDYLTEYHLRDLLDPGRVSYVEGRIDGKVAINTDYDPAGFLYYLLLEQTKFYPDLDIDVPAARGHIIAVFIVIAVLSAMLSFLKSRSLILLNAAVVGFTSIGLTTIIYILFQIYSGALFWKLGILIASFMIGLASGTSLVNAVSDRFSLGPRALALYYSAWALFGSGLIAAMRFAHNIFYADHVFYACSFLTGALTGAMYPILSGIMAGKFTAKNISVSLYASDLAGAFAGTLVFSIFFIPFLGVNAGLVMIIFLAAAFSLKHLLR